MNNQSEQCFPAGFLLLGLCLTGWLTAAQAAPAKTSPPAVAADYGKLPLSFVENRGQADPAVRFMSRGPGYSLFLTAAETVLTLTARDAKTPAHPSAAGRTTPAYGTHQNAAPERRTALRMTLAGGQPPRAIVGREPLPGVVNVFRGKDPAQWHTGLPTFG